MKLNGLLLALFFVCGVAAAQTPSFEKGDKVINLGVGIGGNYYSGFTSGLNRTPFLSASLDIGIVDGILDKGTIGIGGIVGFSSVKWTDADFGWKESNILIGPRGTFHYPLVDKLDTYAGLLLGYHIVSYKYTGSSGFGSAYTSSGSAVYFSGFIGARYYFTDSFGIMLELGSGGLSLANFGVALKF